MTTVDDASKRIANVVGQKKAHDPDVRKLFRDLIESAEKRGREEGRQSERKMAERRDEAKRREAWDEEHVESIARLLAVLAETVPIPRMVEIIRLSPLAEPWEDLRELARLLGTVDVESADELYEDLTKAWRPPSSQPGRVVERRRGGSGNEVVWGAVGFFLGGGGA